MKDLEYISSENYRNQIDIWCRAYNISREKSELFHDFLMSLYDLIEDTFLGTDVLNLEEDQFGHFSWCWDRTIENFEKEKIYFKEKGLHFEYLWNLYIEAYYNTKMNNNTSRINEFFNMLFSFKHLKTRTEFDMFVEVYKILEQSLKK